jgi:hypothetical protein
MLIENQRTKEMHGAEIIGLLRNRYGSQIDERDRLQKLVDEIRPRLNKARQDETTASERLITAKLDMDREETGKDGRPKGRKDRYREAQSRGDAARPDVAKAKTEFDIYAPQLRDAEAKLEPLKVVLSFIAPVPTGRVKPRRLMIRLVGGSGNAVHRVRRGGDFRTAGADRAGLPAIQVPRLWQAIQRTEWRNSEPGPVPIRRDRARGLLASPLQAEFA